MNNQIKQTQWENQFFVACKQQVNISTDVQAGLHIIICLDATFKTVVWQSDLSRTMSVTFQTGYFTLHLICKQYHSC